MKSPFSRFEKQLTRPRKVYFFLSVVFILFGAALLYRNPYRARALYSENCFFENLTVFFYLISLVVSLLIIFQNKQKRPKKFWVMLSLILVFFIGDELSWGLNFFGITKPEVLGVIFDGFHDVVSLILGVITKGYLPLFILTMLGISYGLFILLLKLRVFLNRNLGHDIFFFFFIGLLLAATALFVDEANLLKHPHKMVCEETLEILASLALLFCSVCGYFAAEKRVSSKS